MHVPMFHFGSEFDRSVINSDVQDDGELLRKPTSSHVQSTAYSDKYKH